MNENTKIAVYYIATGDYKRLFSEFVSSLNNFFPKCKKIVKLISDDLEEYDDYEEGSVSVELCPRINDYPWPIITLYKMWHILENIDETCDYSCYFNANAIINKHVDDIFNLDKITVSYHSFNSNHKAYNPWDHININPSSIAYLENGTYEYIQGGFFFGKTELIKKLCEEVVNMVKYDTSRSLIAQWHDESYLNKWCYMNSNIVDKKYLMTVYKEEVDLTKFIYLRPKNDYSIKK